MLIILEGVDGSGKTTLANSLKKHGFEVLRRTKSDKNFTFAEIRQYQVSSTKYVIDRALLTPWAYRLLNNDTLNSDDFAFSELITLLYFSPVIYCNCANSYNYAIARGEENIRTKNKHNKLRSIYKFIINTIRLYNITTVFEYNFETHAVEDVIKFIKEVQNAV